MRRTGSDRRQAITLQHELLKLGRQDIRTLADRRNGKGERIKTHLDRYIMTIWIAAGVLMTLMVILSLKNEEFPTPYILGVTAMATGVCGLMVRFNPAVIGAIVFFIAAIIASFLNGTDQLLVFAVAVILGYLIPGYILRSSKNGSNV